MIDELPQLTSSHNEPQNSCGPKCNSVYQQALIGRIMAMKELIFVIQHTSTLLSSGEALNRMVNDSPRISHGFSPDHFSSLLLLHFLI